MPGVYRKKICPACAKEHRKRGPYCSRQCANATISSTPEVRAKMSETHTKLFADVNSDYRDTILSNVQKAGNAARGIDTTPIPPRQRTEHLGEVIDGDLWFSDEDLR